MRILVTGGAGFIGSHTCDRLVSSGHDVTVLDSLTEPVHRGGVPNYLTPGVDLFVGDVRNRELLANLLRRVDAVYHLAAYQDYLTDFARFTDVNVTSTALIYEVAVNEGLDLSRVVVASSQSAMGEGLYVCPDHGEQTPDMRPEENLQHAIWDLACPVCSGPMTMQKTPERVSNPQNAYGMSKYAEETVALNLGRRYGIPTVALRYSIVQGPRQSVYNAYSGACRIFSLHYLLGGAPVVYEDGGAIRDYVNIHDVVDANELVLTADDAVGRVFNVGGGAAYTTLEFAKIVQAHFGSTAEPRITGEYRFGDTRHIVSDVSALTALGWSPRRTPAESVAEYAEWLRDMPGLDDVLAEADAKMREMGRGQERHRVKAVVLAAGLGTRLRPLTDSVPKCLVEVGGTTLLDRWLDELAATGVEEVLVNTHHLADKVRQHVAGRSDRPPGVTLTHEPVLLGSAGTLLANADFFDADDMVLAVNADNLTTFRLRRLVEAHRDGGSVATITVFQTPRPTECGIVEVEDGLVTSFEEKPSAPRSTLANAGMYALHPNVLRMLDAGTRPLDIGHHLLPLLVGRARALSIGDAYLSDIGTMEALDNARCSWPEEQQ